MNPDPGETVMTQLPVTRYQVCVSELTGVNYGLEEPCWRCYHSVQCLGLEGNFLLSCRFGAWYRNVWKRILFVDVPDVKIRVGDWNDGSWSENP